MFEPPFREWAERNFAATEGAVMPMPTEDDYKLANKNQEDAIAELVDVVLREPPEGPGAGYSKLVYKTAWNLVEVFKAADAVYNYRLTDLDEYKAEIERRRQIGLTIDPATAETTFWWADLSDPYYILDPKYHWGGSGRERFARHPGASNCDWVDFNDLPEATREALWERDGRKLSFPYGLHPDDDVIKCPPADDSLQGPNKSDAPQT
jgi:hypothetical protein